MTEYILEKDFKEIYEMGPQIGKGLFGNIKLAFNKNSNRVCALKTISKDLLIKYKKESCALREKKALTRVFKHPLFAQLFDYRQTEHHIYFELSYECRHDITPYIEKLGGFCKETAKFYSAEVACAIEYLHILGIAHRNIKPENVLVKENLHICLTDFKSCMYLNDSEYAYISSNQKQRTSSDRSEEMIKGKNWDIWSYGELIYYMLCAKWPYSKPLRFENYKYIDTCQYSFDVSFDGDSNSLISSIIKNNYNEIVESTSLENWSTIKSKSFFNGVNWDNLREQKAPNDISRCKILFNNNLAINTFIQIYENRKPLKNHNPNKFCSLMPPINVIRRHEWDIYVQNRPILRYGLVLKKKNKYHRQLLRVLIVSEGPLLLYLDPSSNKLKKYIKWDATICIEAQTPRKFQIWNSRRCYYFEDIESNAGNWVSVIENIHEKYFGRSINQHKTT